MSMAAAQAKGRSSRVSGDRAVQRSMALAVRELPAGVTGHMNPPGGAERAKLARAAQKARTRPRPKPTQMRWRA